MNALKKAGKADRRVFNEEDERELLSLGSKNSVYDDVLDYSYSEEEQPDSISLNYNKLVSFRTEEELAAEEETRQEVVADVYTPAEVETVSAPAEAVGESDLTPTSTTMQFSGMDMEDDFLTASSPVQAKRPNLFRSKAVILAYAIVIVTLISLIAINAAVLLRERGSISALYGDVQALQQQSSQLGQEIDSLTNQNTVIENGMEDGMTSEGTNTQINLLKPQLPENEGLQGNWFDSFCNFITNIFN